MESADMKHMADMLGKMTINPKEISVNLRSLVEEKLIEVSDKINEIKISDFSCVSGIKNTYDAFRYNFKYALEAFIQKYEHQEKCDSEFMDYFDKLTGSILMLAAFPNTYTHIVDMETDKSVFGFEAFKSDLKEFENLLNRVASKAIKILKDGIGDVKTNMDVDNNDWYENLDMINMTEIVKTMRVISEIKMKNFLKITETMKMMEKIEQEKN